MASVEHIPIDFYIPETDEYVLPGGTSIPGADVRKARKEAQRRANSARNYDPYNHMGKHV